MKLNLIDSSQHATPIADGTDPPQRDEPALPAASRTTAMSTVEGLRQQPRRRCRHRCRQAVRALCRCNRRTRQRQQCLRLQWLQSAAHLAQTVASTLRAAYLKRHHHRETSFGTAAKPMASAASSRGLLTLGTSLTPEAMAAIGLPVLTMVSARQYHQSAQQQNRLSALKQSADTASMMTAAICHRAMPLDDAGRSRRYARQI